MKTKEVKQLEARARQVARASRTPKEQLALVASRRGFSRREQARLLALATPVQGTKHA